MNVELLAAFVIVVGVLSILLGGPLIRWLQKPLPEGRRGQGPMKPAYARLVGIVWVGVGLFMIFTPEGT